MLKQQKAGESFVINYSFRLQIDCEMDAGFVSIIQDTIAGGAGTFILPWSDRRRLFVHEVAREWRQVRQLYSATMRSRILYLLH